MVNLTAMVSILRSITAADGLRVSTPSPCWIYMTTLARVDQLIHLDLAEDANPPPARFFGKADYRSNASVGVLVGVSFTSYLLVGMLRVCG